MLIELPMKWITVMNIVTLPAIQMGCAWAFTKMPARWFERSDSAASTAKTQTPLFLKTWKRWIPDGAAWFAGGFHKRSLTSRDEAYLRRFAAEARRGECCHWLAMVLCVVPFVWNPWWACLVIALYALAANLPCILLQRVNRARLLGAIARLHARRAEAKSARS